MRDNAWSNDAGLAKCPTHHSTWSIKRKMIFSERHITEGKGKSSKHHNTKTQIVEAK